MSLMVADLVTMTSFTSPGSLSTRTQAELMVSFTRSILSEIFAIEERSRVQNQKTRSVQNKNTSMFPFSTYCRDPKRCLLRLRTLKMVFPQGIS
jgi:hypothetical protein